jgi:small multidrug resistance pump
MSWLMLSGAILAEVTATLALRASDGFAKWGWLFLVAAGYGGAFFLLSLVLKAGMPVGVAYGVWAACGVALTSVLGAVIFSDPFTWQTALGIVLIGGGVILLETGGSANPHA